MKKSALVASLVVLGLIQGVCWASFNCDFEDSAYVPDATFSGVDGWSSEAYWTALVTPMTSGYSKFLAGTKSGVIYDDARQRLHSRMFSTFGQSIADNTEIGVLFETTAGYTAFKFLVTDFAGNQFGFGTLDAGGGTGKFATISGETVTPRDDIEIRPVTRYYRARMVTDFTTDQFTVYLAAFYDYNKSPEYSEMLVGTFSMGSDVSAAAVQANGGLKMTVNGGAYIDDVTIYPEPVPYSLISPPAFSPDGGSFTTNLGVLITCDTPGAKIHYTLDGTTPSLTEGTEIDNNTVVTVDHTATLKAIVIKEDRFSLVKSADYTLLWPAGVPRFSCTFEDSVYVPDETFSGVDGWSSEASWTALVTPMTSGYPNFLTGTKSGVIYDDSRQRWHKRLFSTFAQNVADNTEIGVLFETTAGYTTFKFLVTDFAGNQFGFGAVPLGGGTGKFAIFAGESSLSPENDIEIRPVTRYYRARMVMDFTTDQFTVYLAAFYDYNKSPEYSEMLVGTFSMGSDVSAAAVQANGGLKMTIDGGAYIDNITLSPERVPLPAPMFSPDGGNYLEARNILITCDTPGAKIRYTDNGTIPTETMGTEIDNNTVITVDHTLTLKAIVINGDRRSLVKSSDYVIPRPVGIPLAGTTVDADLSDWAGATWAPLDQNYTTVQPADLNNTSSYAVKWTPGKVYVAVKVRDTNHVLVNNFVPGDNFTFDEVEIYLHTTGSATGGEYWETSGDAQQYLIGIRNDNPNAVWAVIGADRVPVPTWANFQAAGRVDGDWLIYEAALTPFQYFNLYSVSFPSPSVVSPLGAGQDIGVDVTAGSYDGSVYGVKSENLLTQKWKYYTQIARHKLTAGTSADLSAMMTAMDATVGGAGYNPQTNLDADNEITSTDLAILLANLQ